MPLPTSTSTPSGGIVATSSLFSMLADLRRGRTGRGWGALFHKGGREALGMPSWWWRPLATRNSPSPAAIRIVVGVILGGGASGGPTLSGVGESERRLLVLAWDVLGHVQHDGLSSRKTARGV
eukprot:scaffold789_cov125-Isochrysis_galbana.AAC.9